MNGNGNGSVPLPVQAQNVLPERMRSAAVVARQVTAVAATGFIAGAATLAVVKRQRPGFSLRPRRRKRRKGVLGEILGTNSFLVDVHMIRRRK